MWISLARRLGGLLVVLFLVATMVFFLTRLAPGDPAAIMLGDQATPEDVARLRATFGLDRPLLVQFALWLKEIATGNFGRSIFLQQPVTTVLWDRAEPTFFLALFSVTIAALVGVPAGIVSAVWRGRIVDQVVSGLALSVVFPLMMLRTPARVGAQRAAAAVGWQAAAASIGSAAGPAATGLVLEGAGIGAYGPTCVVIAVLLGAVLWALESGRGAAADGAAQALRRSR